MKKRIIVDVDEQFHTNLLDYAKADRRTVRQIVMLALDSYMAQNPIYKENDRDANL